MHLVGYTLLLLALIDIAHILIPPQFMDPNWEFEAIGNLVERVPVPLIAFALVFYGGLERRNRWERWTLKPLAVVAILWGICFWLMVPLGLADSFRIHQQNIDQLEAAASRQLTNLDRLETTVKQADEADVAQLAGRFQLIDPSQEEAQFQTTREGVLDQIKKARTAVKTSLKEDSLVKQKEVVKKALKWLLGALISGSSLIYLGYLMQKAINSRKTRP